MAPKPKKRKNIRERNGKFYYRYSVKYEAVVDGKVKMRRKQKESDGFATAKEAEQEGIRIKAKQLAGTFVDEKDILFSEWADKWADEFYSTTGKVKDTTVNIRKDSLKAAKKHFSGIRLKDITPLQYQGFLNYLKNEGRSEKTIIMVHEAMRLAIKKAVQLKIIESNFIAEAELPGFQKTVEQLETEDELPDYMEKDELAKFLKAAIEYGDSQIYNALFTLAFTGLRIGEFCALKDTDFDEVNRQLSITKTLHLRRSYDDFYLGTPKTPSSKRKVDLGQTVIQVIKNQLAWRKMYKFSIGSDYYKGADFLFVNDRRFPGYPMAPRELSRHMKNILKLANLPETLSPHSLRHTYTSLMAEAGVELPAIQRLLGHQNDTMTKKVYLHVTKPKKREAVELFDKLMEGLI